MEAVTVYPSVPAGIVEVEEKGFSHLYFRLLPLWRYAIWVAALFVLLAVAVAVRLDVQRLQMDLDRNDRVLRNATVLHERLNLEMNSRKRLMVVEAYAAQRGLEAAPIVLVEGGS